MNRFEIINDVIVSFLGFDDGDNKTTLLIPEGPTEIQKIDISGDFKCEDINTIVIPKTIKHINKNAFIGFKSITKIQCHSDAFTVENHCLLSRDKKTLYLIERAFDGTISLPNELTYICDECFINCQKLESLIIPDGVIYIGKSCFERCVHLENIRLPRSLKCINDRTFHYCDSLREITIPSLVTKIEENAFSDCYSLKEVDIQSNKIVEVGNYCFEECQNLIRIDFLHGVKKIGDYSFAGCKALTEVSLPNTVLRVGKNAFASCNNLTVFSQSEYVKQYCNALNIVFENDN